MSSWLSMPIGLHNGVFKVEQGHVSSLGTIAFQPLLSIKNSTFWSSNSSRKAFVVRLEEKQYLEKFVFNQYPNITKTLNQTEVLGWKEDQMGDIRNKIGNLAKNNAYGYSTIILNDFAHAAVTAKFGQLKLLSKDKSWQLLNLPTNAELSAIFEQNNKLYAAGERGQLFSKEKNTETWFHLIPVPATEVIIWLGKTSDENYALTNSANMSNVYKFKNIEEPWQKVGEFKRKPSKEFFVQNGGLFPYVTKDGKFKIIHDNRLFDYDINTQKWTSTSTKSLKGFAQLKNGILISIEVSQWDGYGDQVYSLEDGKTWQTINRRLSFFGDNKTETSLPTILSNQQLVTLGRFTIDGKQSNLKIITNDLTQTPKVTKDTSHAWTAHGDAKEEFSTMLPKLTLESTIYFLCVQGQIVSTSDFGATWDNAVDINIAGLQKEFNDLIKTIIAEAKAEKAVLQTKLTNSEETTNEKNNNKS